MQFGQQISLLPHDDIIQYFNRLHPHAYTLLGDLVEVLAEDEFLDGFGEVVGVLLRGNVDVLLDLVGDEHDIKEMIDHFRSEDRIF